METQRPQITKAVLRKENGAGGINLPDFRLSYKATVISMVLYGMVFVLYGTGTKTEI